jgi:hypothetical protein
MPSIADSTTGEGARPVILLNASGTQITDFPAAANGVLIGAVNETAPATDTASSGMNGRLQRIAQRLTTLLPVGQTTKAASLGVALASDQFPNAAESAPAATTITVGAYAALDQVGTLLTFTNMVSTAGNACRIDEMHILSKANVGAALQLWLFNAAPTLTSPGDNNAWQPTDGDMATCVGIIDSGPYYVGSATTLNQFSTRKVDKVCVTSGSTSLFGYLVTSVGSTPSYASTTDLTVRLVRTPDV